MSTQVSGHRLPYPSAVRLELVDLVHGHRVPDPYRWLEDGESAQTRQWAREQRIVTEGYLHALGTRERFAARLGELAEVAVTSVPVWRGERSFFLRRDRGRESSALYVESGGVKRVVLDPEMLDPSGKSAIAGWEPSPDGRLLAYQIMRRGTERSELWVLNVDSGELVDEPIHGTRYSHIAWLPDSGGFYYVRGRDADRRHAGSDTRHHRVWLHRLGDRRPDPIIFGAGHPMMRYELSIDNGRWLIISARVGAAPCNEVHLADLWETSVEAPRFRTVQAGLDALTRATVAPDDGLYLQTTHQAARGRICVADPADPDQRRWSELVSEDTSAVLSGFTVVSGPGDATRLFVVRARNTISEVSVHDTLSGAQVAAVALPGLGTVTDLSTHPDGGSSVWFHYMDHVTAPVLLRYDARHDTLARDAVSELAGEPTVAVPVTSSYHACPSTDDARIGVFVIAPAGCSQGPDRPRPTILTGYGGFGVSMVPRFQADVPAWVEAGGVFVIACVRGGGEHGRDWHRAGARENKARSFEDLDAVAQWLITCGWTTTGQLGIVGASNAGLLVGGALTQRPDRYAAAVCAAPLLDMTRYERFGLGPSWRSEYGSADRQEEFEWLLSYSPYHHVVEGTAYPATLFVSYDEDTRVDPMHARKMCAALQHATAGDAPILFYSVPEAGHVARPVRRETAVGADILAFIAHHTGLAAPV